MRTLAWIFAVLGVIAAFVLAAPLFRTSCRTPNERSSSSTLKTLASAQADFRGNDRDANGVQDFWRADVSGLYGVLPAGSKEMIKLIEISMAAADVAPTGAAALGAEGPGQIALDSYTVPAPRAGYFYKALRHADEKPGALDPQRFAACAYPAAYRKGALAYIISEAGTVYQRDLGRPGPPEVFPDLDTLKREWRKLD